MSKKNYRNNSNNDRYQVEDDFEDFGYEVKNIRRQSKKKVTKFKREQDHYEDSYWSGTQYRHSTLKHVLYGSRQEFTWTTPTASPSEPSLVMSWCSLRRCVTPSVLTSNLSDSPMSGWTCSDSLDSLTCVSDVRGDTWRTGTEVLT